MGLSFFPKAAPSGTCEEAGEESAKRFFASSIIPGLRDQLVIVFVCIVENAPLMNHPNRTGMYQCLLIVNLTFIIFNHASLLLPNSPFSSCLVPRTPYSPFSLAQGMATRKSTIFAVDQADTWSWVASSTAHYGSVIIFSTTSCKTKERGVRRIAGVS